METASIYWIVAFILLVVIELATMGLTTIWFAGGAVAGFICSMLGLPELVQIVVFLAVSILYPPLCHALCEQEPGQDECGSPDREGRSRHPGDQ